MSQASLESYVSDNEENKMEVVPEAPFILLQFHSTDKEFKDNLLLAKDYSYGKYNCVNLSLVLLGIIDESDIKEYLEKCTNRGVVTTEEEIDENFKWSLEKISEEFPGLKKSVIQYPINGNKEAFSSLMLDLVGGQGYLKEEYSTPLLVQWKDGGQHMVVLRKGGQQTEEGRRLGTAIIDAQVNEGDDYPLLFGVFDEGEDEDKNQKQKREAFINNTLSIFILRGQKIDELAKSLAKINPGKDMMSWQGGKRKKRKTRRSKKRGLKSVRRKTIRGSSLSK